MFREAFAPYQRSLSSIWQTPRIAVTLLIGLVLMFIMSACVGQPVGISPTSIPKSTATATATPVPCSAWRTISSPNSLELPQSVLSAVSMLSPQMAVAVGHSFRESSAQGLIEQWDGTTWHIVANLGTDILSGVAALSPSDIWAVGKVETMPTYSPLSVIEHWNGTQWTRIPPPTPNTSSGFTGVVAVAANDVWAVGSSEAHPLAERWDGASWQVVATATPADASASYFNAVARIPDSRQLWAVGSVQYTPAPGGEHEYFQALIERWDGSAWRVVASPALPQGAFGSTLNGVVALSATDAWAVGNYTASNHTIRTLIAHWDGATWKVVASPDTWGSLASVAAAHSHDVRAVGYVTSSDGNIQRVLVEQWDGSTWHTVTASEPGGASHSGLSGITTDSAGNFWAVGSYRNTEGNSQTLIERCP